MCSGLHTTPDSFRLSQCPPAASTPAPGSPYQPLTAALAARTISLSGLPRGLFGDRSGGNFHGRLTPPLPLPSLSTSRSPAHWYGPLRVRNIPATGRRDRGLHATPDCGTGQSEPPGRLPPAPGPCVIGSPCCHGTFVGSLRAAVSTTFVAFSAVHLRSRELANTDTSLATLLTIAHAVVTRRRAEVCTLPLSLSGGLRASRSPSSCTGLP